MNGQLRSPSAELPPMSRKARGRDQGQQVVMLAAEEFVVAPVPGGIPVGVLRADAPFAADGGLDPLVERGQVQHSFALANARRHRSVSDRLH